MRTSYFTLGFDHVHKVGEETLDYNCVVKVTAEAPRDVMFQSFGNKWSMEYVNKPDMSYFSKGIYNLTDGCWEEDEELCPHCGRPLKEHTERKKRDCMDADFL